MNNKFNFIDRELQILQEENRLRRLQMVNPVSTISLDIGEKQVINFSSNDYLGLSKHPMLAKKSAQYLQRFGSGATASRLVCGNYSIYDQLEKKIAQLKGTENAVVFNSGYQANVSLIPIFADRHSLILADRLAHKSLIQGALLSSSKLQRFHHDDMDHLEQQLISSQTKNYSRIVIISESVFSMDGDRCNLDQLVALSKKFSAILIIDEAHATGVLGVGGRGLAYNKGVDIVIGTFGKALGSFGAYVACSDKLREYIINCCSGFIYTTALPPAVLGASEAAIDLLGSLEKEREFLIKSSDYLRSKLQSFGYETGNSSTQIVPVIIGTETQTLQLSQKLFTSGFLAVAIRPPTVGKGKSRIRLSLSALHTMEQIESLLEVFKEA